MRLFITLGSLLLAAAPVAATPFDSDSFRDAKTGYRVDIHHDGDAMLLDGFNPQSRARFHLTVSRGVVTGIYEGRPIKFVVGQRHVGDELAANTAN